MADKQRKLHTVLEDGTEIYEYPDGALRRASGAYYKRPPQAAKAFDAEGSALANLRKSEIKQHRIETLQGEVRRTLKNKLKTKTAEQAGAKLVGNIIDIAVDTDERAADRLASTKFALDAAGMKAKEAGQAPAITLHMDEAAVRQMHELMGRPRLEDVVEGEYEDVE